MTGVEIRKSVLELIHRIAPEQDLSGINPGENLREALDIDSFDFLSLLVAIHERLGVTVPESDYSKVSTLNDMVAYLEANVRINLH
jgi:acyl carrier protein